MASLAEMWKMPEAVPRAISSIARLVELRAMGLRNKSWKGWIGWLALRKSIQFLKSGRSDEMILVRRMIFAVGCLRRRWFSTASFWRPYSVLGAGGVVSDGLSSQDGKTRLLEIKTKAAPSSANLSANAMVAVVLIKAAPCGSDSQASIPVTAAQRIAIDLKDVGICHFACGSARSR